MKSKYIYLFILASLFAGCESGFVVSDDCTVGNKKCENNILYVCTEGDADSIHATDKLTFWKPQECPNGCDEKGCIDNEPTPQSCSNTCAIGNPDENCQCSCPENCPDCNKSTGQCTDSCKDGEKKCDHNSLMICQDNKWKEETTCPNGCHSDNGDTYCKDCTAPNTEKKCDGNTLKTCQNDYKWKETTCSNGCHSDNGDAYCRDCTTPNSEKKCDGNILMICQDDYKWKETTCSNGCHSDNGDAYCKDCTEPNTEKKCDGNMLMICQDDYKWKETTCSNGCHSDNGDTYCKDCTEPNTEKKCDGNMLMTCNENYQWRTETCEQGKTCEAGVCTTAFSVGDTIVFGNYNGSPIQWYIMDNDTVNHRLMLLAMDVSEKRPYNTKEEEITWEQSTIRSWLNGYGSSENKRGIDYTSINFISSAFTNTERAMIPKVTVVNADNPQYGTDGGNNTQDYVFMLSIDEINMLLSTQDNICTKIHCTLNWWLRSPGQKKSKAAFVDHEGSLHSDGYGVLSNNSVRPALWLSYLTCNENGSCMSLDANHNHMYDQYEIASKQGEYCREYADCDSTPGQGDGFCDSYIGYKCSTKCTSNEQCTDIDGGGYHYICREDGRCAPEVFETEWKTESNNSTIHFPGGHGKCDFDIDWGDNNIEHFKECKDYREHTYTKAGTYHIKVTGTLEGWGCTYIGHGYYCTNANSLCDKANNEVYLTKVISFGPIVLSNPDTGIFAFACLDQLESVSILDIPNFNNFKNASGMFYRATIFNSDINHWDMSHIENIRAMFCGSKTFNKPLNNWDISKVTNMNGTFCEAEAFNQPLNDWNTSSVTNMQSAFQQAHSFNQPLNNWNTSNVTNMSYMFGATCFNQSLDAWNTSNVTSMRQMFQESDFNQPIGNWITTKVTDMHGMFYYAQSFNQDLSIWDTSNVTDMSIMFTGAASFSQPIGSWNTSNVTDMSSMFESASTFNHPLNNWNTSKVKSMANMFKQASKFNQPIDKWNTSSVTNMSGMFYHAQRFNQPIDKWNTSSVTDMSEMFREAFEFNAPIGNWDTSNVINMSYMFAFTHKFNESIVNWNTSKVTNMVQMFSGNAVFNQPLKDWDVSQVTSMQNMFLNASAFNQDLSTWKLSSSVNTSSMFKSSGLSQTLYCKIICAWGKENADLGLGKCNCS